MNIKESPLFGPAHLKGILILILFFLILSEQVSISCKCYEVGKEPIDEASVVINDNIFIGEPIDISSGLGSRVKFKVIKNFKNALNSEIELEVTNGGSEDGCGYPFELNKQYLVLAVGNIVSACGTTKLFSEASEDIKNIEGFVAQGLDKISWDLLTPKEQDNFRKKWSEAVRTE